MRMHGHGAHDDMSYVPEAMREEWAERDPIERYSERLVAEHGFAADEVELDPRRGQGLRRRVRRRRRSPRRCPTRREATAGVFADDVTPLGDGQAPWSHWSAGRREERAPDGAR